MRYEDCNHTFFLSYCRADNNLFQLWVDNFKKALETSLKGALDRPDFKKPFFDKETGPIEGYLDTQLREAIKKSFSLIVVPGPKYHEHKEWCLKEVEMFREEHGEEAMGSRVLVLPMTKSSIDALENEDKWRKSFQREIDASKNSKPGNVWFPCYDENADSRPIHFNHDLRMNGESARELVLKVVSKLGEKITSASKKENKTTTDVVNDHTTRPRTMRIAVGPATVAIKSEFDDWLNKIRASTTDRIEFVEITDDDIESEDFDLRQRYKDEPVDGLWIPTSFEQPYCRKYPGGHMRVLDEQWKAHKDETKDLPDPVFITFHPAPDRFDPGLKLHFEFFERLRSIAKHSDELLRELCPQKDASPQRRVIVDAPTQEWDDIARWIKNQPNLSLDPTPHDVRCIRKDGRYTPDVAEQRTKKLEAALREAGGMILLWYDKSEGEDTLEALIKKIEGRLTDTLKCAWRKKFELVVAVFRPPHERKQPPFVGDYLAVGFHPNPQHVNRFEPEDSDQEQQFRKVLHTIAGLGGCGDLSDSAAASPTQH